MSCPVRGCDDEPLIGGFDYAPINLCGKHLWSWRRGEGRRVYGMIDETTKKSPEHPRHLHARIERARLDFLDRAAAEIRNRVSAPEAPLDGGPEGESPLKCGTFGGVVNMRTGDIEVVGLPIVDVPDHGWWV